MQLTPRIKSRRCRHGQTDNRYAQSKKKRMTQLRNQQSLRTRESHPAVKELLSIANKLPPRPSQRDLESGRGSAYHLVHSHIHENLLSGVYGQGWEMISRDLHKALERLPPELQAFVTQDCTPTWNTDTDPPSPSVKFDERWRQDGPHLWDYALEIDWSATSPIESSRQRYVFLFAIRDLLEAIARPDAVESSTKRMWEEEGRPPALIDPEGWREGALNSLRDPRRLYLRVTALRNRVYVSPIQTSSGTHELEVDTPTLFQVLKGVESERLRKCSICEKLFWAGRLDQSACGSRCSNVLRGRMHRKRILRTQRPGQEIKGQMGR